MSRIVFFSIPAYGHTNPTVEVVRQLVRRGHRVRYYSFEEFRVKLACARAEFPPPPGIWGGGWGTTSPASWRW